MSEQASQEDRKLKIKTISFYKQLHAKLGVCIDERLDMSLERCQALIRDCMALLDSEALAIENTWDLYLGS